MTTESQNNLESDDYDTLLWSAEPVLQSLPSRDIELPNTVAQQKLEKMCVGCFFGLFCYSCDLRPPSVHVKKDAGCRMRMLQDAHAMWPEAQRKKVAMWVKQQILQNSFNCTTPASGSTSGKKKKKVPKEVATVNCASDGKKNYK